ncbi:MAG: tetratricopeptide repeat protein [Saprospiraceae bacterium]|nr:tetratricopeptide repeat protein [Saprospiraceae bacterium]
MRNIFLLLLILLSYCPTTLAQSAINGIIAFHNSQFNNKTKVDYAQGVQVEGMLVKTKPTLTESNGAFKLIAVTARPNEKIRIKVLKDGYQVVNPVHLSGLTDQTDTLRIVIAKIEDIESARATYFTLGKSLSESAFKAKLMALDSSLALIYKSENTDEKRILALEQQIKSINKSGKKLEAIVHDITYQFSLINLDDMPPFYQTTFQFFQKGDIDAALELLEKAELNSKLAFLIGQRKRKTANEIDPIVEQKFQKTICAFMLQADFYQLKWEIEKADSVYQLMLKYDAKNVDIQKKYASFLKDINEQNRAKILCEKAVTTVESSEDKIELMNKLGLLYTDLGEYNKAEKILSQATDMAEWEIINRKDIFEPLYALAQLHLGQTLTKMKNFNQAQGAFALALKYHKQYATKSPAKTKDSLRLADTYNSMAINYLKQNNFQQSLDYFDKTWAIYSEISDSTSLYKNQVADIKNNYAQLYLAQKDTVSALKFFSQEMAIYAAAVRSKNTAFDADYLAGLINLSQIYLSDKNYDKAIPLLDTIADLQKKLVLAHPLNYEIDLEKTLETQANIYYEQKKYVLFEEIFRKIAILHSIILKTTPQYKADICAFYSRFGAFYQEQNKLELAESQYKTSIELRKELVDKDALAHGENQKMALQHIISIRDTFLLPEIFENKILAHKKIQDNCRNELINTQNKIIAALEKSSSKDKQGKLNEAYGTLAAYYLTMNKIKEAEAVAQKQENVAAHFLLFVYSMEDKFTEAQSLFEKIGDKKSAKKRCSQWANDFYGQKIISWDTKTKINKWLEASATLGLLGN